MTDPSTNPSTDAPVPAARPDIRRPDIQTLITMLLAPRACPADPPGFTPHTHQFQVPSDRLRDKAEEFVRLAVALIPDPVYHDAAAEIVHDLVVIGEQALHAQLEGSPEWQRSGFRLALDHAPLRYPPLAGAKQ